LVVFTHLLLNRVSLHALRKPGWSSLFAIVVLIWSWPIPTIVVGFVSDMPDRLGISNVLVTKAGPDTIAKALTTGISVILTGLTDPDVQSVIPGL